MRGRSSDGHRETSSCGRYPWRVIVRVLTATVPDEYSVRLHELMRQQLPILRAYDGLIYVKLARRLMGRHEEVVLIEEWRDPAALYAWTGPNLERPRLLPGAESLITDLRITHFEALDIEPLDALAGAFGSSHTSRPAAEVARRDEDPAA